MLKLKKCDITKNSVKENSFEMEISDNKFSISLGFSSKRTATETLEYIQHMPTETLCNTVSQELQNDRRLIETIEKYNGRQNYSSESQKNKLSKVPLSTESIDEAHSIVKMSIDMGNINPELLQAACDDVRLYFRECMLSFACLPNIIGSIYTVARCSGIIVIILPLIAVIGLAAATYGCLTGSRRWFIGGSAMSFATSGAMLGNMFAPVIGAAVGGVVGAVVGTAISYKMCPDFSSYQKRKYN